MQFWCPRRPVRRSLEAGHRPVHCWHDDEQHLSQERLSGLRRARLFLGRRNLCHQRLLAILQSEAVGSAQHVWPVYSQDQPAEPSWHGQTQEHRSQGYAEINFHLFEENDAGTELDLKAELDTVKWARRVFASVPPPLGPLTPVEPPCPGRPAPDGSCDDDLDKEWITTQIFGHHPTSTCAIGADNDSLAVLDAKFRVRGVKGLRVVDASAFPRVPGPFPVLPTFMLSEKATESVLEDANRW